MKKFGKADKAAFVAKVRKMKAPKKGASKQPMSKRVPDASGPGGSLGGY